jgi:hypothetical protein
MRPLSSQVRDKSVQERARGAHRHKTKGSGFRDLHGARRTDKLDKGPYHNPDPRIEVPPKLRNLKKVPIGEFAAGLLVKYLRRSMFWSCVTQDSIAMPVEIAGQAFLFLKETQAREVLKELEAAGGPYPWFLGEAMLAYHRKDLPPGAATKGSVTADEFYARLAGPEVELAFEQATSGRRRVTVGELTDGLTFIQVQCMCYRAINRPGSLMEAICE